MHILDNGYPIQSLKEYRRKLADELKEGQYFPTPQQIGDLGAVQQAIAALEAVAAEVVAERPYGLSVGRPLKEDVN